MGTSIRELLRQQINAFMATKEETLRAIEEIEFKTFPEVVKVVTKTKEMKKLNEAEINNVLDSINGYSYIR